MLKALNVFDTKNFKNELNLIEKLGVRTLLQEVFNLEDIYLQVFNSEKIQRKSNSYLICIITALNDYPIEENWKLKYFALTYSGQLIAVAWNEETEMERFYIVGL